MTGDFNLHMMGRFGNQLFQYAFARGYAERHGLVLHTDPWVGQRLFDIADPPLERELPRRDEFTLMDGEADVGYLSYAQQQTCLIYTREQARRWFTLRPEVGSRLDRYRDSVSKIVGHRRVGDYPGYGYPVVSARAYTLACQSHGLDPGDLQFVTEEDPLRDPYFDGWAEYFPDFARLMLAPVLLRGNSCFSWWAAALGDHERVFAPIIEGKEGGREHDCEFVEGNWPRLANLHFVTDLHLADA